MKLRDINICIVENGYTVRVCYDKDEKNKDDQNISMYDSKEYVVEDKERVGKLVTDLLNDKMSFKEEALEALTKDKKSDEDEKDED